MPMTKRPKIAVNTRFLLKDKLEGIGRFTDESLKRITKQHPEVDFVFLFDRSYDESFIYNSNVIPKVVSPPARHPLLWYLWFEWAVPRALKQIQPDLFLSTDSFLSLSTDVPTALVIHDIGFEHFPEHLDYLPSKYYRHYTPLYARKARRIATVSEYTRQDVCKRYKVDSSKIDVVYNGGSDVFKPVSELVRQEIQKQYTQACPYFVFVGTIHPRKNIANIFRAFDQFKAKYDRDWKLLMVGRKGWTFKEIFEVYENMQYKEEVIFTGHVQLDELARITAGASAMLYPSVFEGFGIPLLEAMHCDVPVISSNTSSLPEVAGDAALLVDPHSIDEIVEAMRRLSVEQALAQNLIKAGREQRKKFGWDKTANALWQTVEKALSDSPA